MAESASTKSSKDISAAQVEKAPREQARRATEVGPQANILALQRAAGNRAVSQLLQSALNHRPSRNVVLQRKSASRAASGGDYSREGEKQVSQREKAGTAQQDSDKGAPLIVRSVLNSGSGRPLDAATQAFMQSRLGHDFSQVRVHTGARAAESARAVKAAAYTVGRDIVFREGRYSPVTTSGRELLAHELTHVIQQTGGDSLNTPALNETESSANRRNGRGGMFAMRRQPSSQAKSSAAASTQQELVIGSANDPYEREADKAAKSVTQPGEPQAAMHQSFGHQPAAHQPSTRAVESLAPVPVPARSALAIQRFPEVEPDMLEKDKKRTFVDPADKTTKPVYDAAKGGYIKNPSSTELSSVIKNGKVAGGFENGKFMYVVDENGKVWVGKRMGESMPHPTLIGGKNPKVQAAGIVEIKAGKITNIDNHSGHFKPPRASLKNAVKSFMKLDDKVFKNLKVASLHMEGGKETFKPFRSLRMLKLRKGDFKSLKKKFSVSAIKGRLRSRSFRSKLKGGAAAIAIVIAAYLLSKWLPSIDEMLRERDLETEEPKVREALEKALEAKIDELDELYEKDPNATIYANVKFVTTTYEHANPSGEEEESYVGTWFVEASYTLAPVSDAIETKYEYFACSGTARHDHFTLSEAISLKDLFEEGEVEAEEEEETTK